MRRRWRPHRRSIPLRRVPRLNRRYRAPPRRRQGSELSATPLAGGLSAERMQRYRRGAPSQFHGSEMNSPEKLTRDDGATIAYRRLAGAAPGIVFLGGFHSDMTGNKAMYLEDYCRRRRLGFLRFDHFGHSASSGEVSMGTIGRWAEDAITVLDSLTQERQILVGASMGGWIMLLAALASPARIDALVGVAAAPDFNQDLLWPRLDAVQRQQLLETGMAVLPSEYDPAGYTYRLSLFEDGRR